MKLRRPPTALNRELARELVEATHLHAFAAQLRSFAESANLRWETAVEAVNFIRLGTRSQSQPFVFMPMMLALKTASEEMQKAMQSRPSMFSTPLH